MSYADINAHCTVRSFGKSTDNWVSNLNDRGKLVHVNVFYVKILLRVASKANTGHYSFIWHLIVEASQSCVTVSLRKQKDEVYFENTLTWGIVTVFWFYQASHAALYLQYWHYCIIYYTKHGADFTTDGQLGAASGRSRWSSPLRLPPPWGSFRRLLLPTQGKIFGTHKKTKHT